METTLTIEVNKELSKTENLDTSIDWQELLERNKQNVYFKLSSPPVDEQKCTNNHNFMFANKKFKQKLFAHVACLML